MNKYCLSLISEITKIEETNIQRILQKSMHVGSAARHRTSVDFITQKTVEPVASSFFPFEFRTKISYSKDLSHRLSKLLS